MCVKDKRRRDLDNRLKPMLYAMQGTVFEDDSQSALLVVDDMQLVALSDNAVNPLHHLSHLNEVAAELQLSVVVTMRQDIPCGVPGPAAEEADLMCHLSKLGLPDSQSRLLSLIWNRRGPTAQLQLDFMGCPALLDPDDPEPE